MNPLHQNISFYNNARDNVGNNGRPAITFLGAIRQGLWKEQIEALRAEQDEAQRRELKKTLPAVTWSGRFTKRKADALEHYTGIICIDVDKLDFTALNIAHDNLTTNPPPGLLSYFESPSGNGLKLLFLTATGPEQHGAMFQAIANYLAQGYYQLEADPSGKDVCRLCFVSYDPAIYINEEAEPITEEFISQWTPAAPAKAPKAPAAPPAPPVDDTAALLQKCHEIVQRTAGHAASGNHNRYAGQFAQQANRYGISEADTITELHAHMPEYDSKELVACVKHHYKKEAHRHGEYLQRRKDRKSHASAQPAAAMPAVNPEGGQYDETIKFWYAVGKVDESQEGDAAPRDYRISYDDFVYFLQANGFYKYKLDSGYQLIHVDKSRNIVEVVYRLQVIEFVINYLKSKTTTEFKRVREVFRRGAKNYCSETILEGLDYYMPSLKRDTEHQAHIFFNNCFLEITRDSIQRREYDGSREEYIWKKQLIDFDYQPRDWAGCDFAEFLGNAITGKKAAERADAERSMIHSVYTSIGYLLHRHKNPASTKAIIATDKVLRRGKENEGRTGKTLLSKAISRMVNTAMIDGRNFSFDRPFPFQQVNVDTELVNFNDIKKNFDFTRLFGMVTEEFSFEKKNQDMITMPFEDAPKFYISANSSLKGDGASTRARQQVIEFTNYYHEEHQPVHDFGRLFFSGWPADEWARFYAFMAHCVQCYLKDGLLPFPLENYAMNKLIDRAGEEFVDYMEFAVLEKLPDQYEFELKALYEGAMAGTPEKFRPKQNEFTARVKAWAEIQGLAINPHKDGGRDRRNGVDYIRFVRIGEAAGDIDTTDLPF